MFNNYHKKVLKNLFSIGEDMQKLLLSTVIPFDGLSESKICINSCICTNFTSKNLPILLLKNMYTKHPKKQCKKLPWGCFSDVRFVTAKRQNKTTQQQAINSPSVHQKDAA